MNIDIIAGERPNFMKIAPIIAEIKRVRAVAQNINCRIFHIGQHYDKKISSDFFEGLGISEPDENLGAGIRFRDLTMPDEINRMIKDSITDYFYNTIETAN